MADRIMEGQRASSLGISTATMKKLPKFNPTKKQQQKVSATNASDNIYWYHYRFRLNAHKCIKPCTFKLTKGIQSIHPNNTEDGFSSDHAGPLVVSVTRIAPTTFSIYGIVLQVEDFSLTLEQNLVSTQLLHKTAAGIHKEKVLLQPMGQQSPHLEKRRLRLQFGKHAFNCNFILAKFRS